MNRYWAGASLVALTCWAGRLEAQAECQDQETLRECWNRLARGAGQGSAAEVEAAVEETAEEGEEEVAEKSTGIPSLGEGLASSLNDFLPVFAGALGLTQTTTEDGGAAFETNLLLPLGASPQRVKVQALLRKPTLHQPLLDALPEATRAALGDSLEDDLADFDDVRITAAWNLENGSFGRAFSEVRPLYDAYFSGIVRTALSGSATQARLASAFDSLLVALDNESELIATARSADAACKDAEIQPQLARLDCFRPEARALITAAASRAARLVAARATELQAALADQGFYEFSGLVNNQPQLQLELNVDLRRDLVGPNEWGIKLRYEGGMSNVNGLRGYCRGRNIADTSVDCLRGYLNAPGRRASIRRGDRFMLAAEFGRRADYVLTGPVALTREGTWHITGTAALGRYIAVSPEGDEIGRIDLSSSYVYYHDDPDRQNRFVFSTTYTQRVTDAVSVAAGVSYASRPEFLEDVDKKVSANFGLRYKFLRD
jgi:hypothetical protein